MLSENRNAGRLAYPSFSIEIDQSASIPTKDLYLSLMHQPLDAEVSNEAMHFLESQLGKAETTPDVLPLIEEDMLTPEALLAWVRDGAAHVGSQFQAYLDGRKNGMPRRYFRSKAHALHFIKSVAPTKLVDGSWIYGFTPHWQDQRFRELIRIYLEELGDGQPEKNHVVLYRQLLDTYGCEWQSLPHEYFVQGAIQLALASHTDRFMPEAIGFNLGYEQLPLHLLITAYELDELNIDPYYFTLHVTVDNAMTGHAQAAVNAVFDAMPQFGNRQEYLKRVANGAKLNNMGISTLDAIEAFDLEQELIAILHEKSKVGRNMHNDRCRIGSRTINQWLSDPLGIPELLDSLEQHGWIVRHDDPKKSRFWKLIESERAEMFGVFSPYEKQVIYDWIAGDALESLPRRERLGESRRLQENRAPASRSDAWGEHGNIIRLNGRIPEAMKVSRQDDFQTETALFETKVASLPRLEDRMALLVEWISPSRHHGPVGLLATRMYARQLGRPVT